MKLRGFYRSIISVRVRTEAVPMRRAEGHAPYEW